MEIKLFGITKDIVGADTISVPEDVQVGNVRELKSWLYVQYPPLQELASMAIAVEHTYAVDTTLLEKSNEIALIPPVSGG